MTDDKRRGGPSGKHLNARRTLSGITDEQWAAYARRAEELGITRNEWIRRVLDKAASRRPPSS